MALQLQESLLHPGEPIPDRTVTPHDEDCQLLCLPLSCCNCILSSRIGGNENVFDYVGDFFRHVWRGLSSDLSAPLVSPAEQKLLSTKYNVKGQCAQNYMAWRRSSLFVMLIPLVLQLVLDCFNQIQFQQSQLALKERDPLSYSIIAPLYVVFDTMSWIAIGLIVLAIILAAIALHYWHHYRLSRRLVFVAWLAYFGGPFLVTAFPYRLALNFNKMQAELNRQNVCLTNALHLSWVSAVLFFLIGVPLSPPRRSQLQA